MEDRQNKIEKMLCSDILGTDTRDFISELELTSMNAYLIGGAVRDAVENRIPRDLDIVLTSGDEGTLNSIIIAKDIKYRINAFGGYKLVFKNITMDIWFIQNHYAFKTDLYKINKPNISRSALINYDSLVYDIKKKTLSSKYYDECVESRKLDIIANSKVVKSNPNPILSLIKLFMIIRRCDYRLSVRAIDYIAEQYYKSGDELWVMIENEYRRHYKTIIEESFERFIKAYMEKVLSDNFSRNHRRNCIDGQYNIYDYIHS